MSNVELCPIPTPRKYSIFDRFNAKKPAKDETTLTGLKTSITNAKIKKYFSKKILKNQKKSQNGSPDFRVSI